MSDERKAAAISHYVREVIHKELQAVPSSNQQTCGYDAILQQISNTEYIYNKDGEQYSADHLRIQVVHFMATYADLVYPEATRLHVLPCAYKDWLLQQLDPQQQLDELAPLGLRLFLKVSSIHTIHILLQIRVELVKIHQNVPMHCQKVSRNCQRFKFCAYSVNAFGKC